MNVNNLSEAREAINEVIEAQGWAFVVEHLRNWVSTRLLWKEPYNEALKFTLGRLDNILENIDRR